MSIIVAVTGFGVGRLVHHLTNGASAEDIAMVKAAASYGIVIGALALLRPRPMRAAIDTALLFGAFVGGDYSAQAPSHGLVAGELQYPAIWLLLAVAACAVLAAAISWARKRPGTLRAAVFALPAACACAEALAGRTWGTSDTLRPVAVGLDGALVIVFLLLLPRGSTTRAAAVLWTAPLAALLLVCTTTAASSDACAQWLH